MHICLFVSVIAYLRIFIVAIVYKQIIDKVKLENDKLKQENNTLKQDIEISEQKKLSNKLKQENSKLKQKLKMKKSKKIVKWKQRIDKQKQGKWKQQVFKRKPEFNEVDDEENNNVRQKSDKLKQENSESTKPHSLMATTVNHSESAQVHTYVLYFRYQNDVHSYILMYGTHHPQLKLM